jgi:hypothetical protein
MSERLVNIGYFGGSHGAFLKYFIDKFSDLTPEIKASPFLDNGTSHNLKVQYSGRVYRYTFEDAEGNPRNDYKFENKGEPQVLVTLDEPSLMNYSRLHFTRESDHEFVGAKIKESNEGVVVSDKFVSIYAEKFFSMYNIDLHKTKAIPDAVLRDFIKITFLDIKQNKSFVKSKTTLQNIDTNTVCISLSEIWNTDQFMKKMKEISEKFGLQLVLDQPAVDLHKEFLSRRINHKTWNRIYDIIDDVKNDKKSECLGLDIIEQGYLYAWLEKSYDFVQAPLTRKFFTNTKEIKEYVTHYPNHYKAMNPNLPMFNNIANPFYLWNKNKTTDKQ